MTRPRLSPWPGAAGGTRARLDAAAAVHEALVLPLAFLTVALLGGLRLGTGGALTFVPPPLMALVLAVMLLAALYRSGTLHVEGLLAPDRGPLARLSGLVVVATLFVGGAQVFNTLTPEAGLLAFAFNLAYLVLFGNTLAAGPDRNRQLASLLVIFGSAFVVKYVVLAAVYSPEAGLAKRVVLALLEGVSLGGLAYQAPGPATGYVAFGTVLVFLVGLAGLPHAVPDVTSVLVVEEAPDAGAPRASQALDRDGR